ncbi:MAG TPA: DRTGG domain-containing protein, partial [Deltaproteobacteria bacterium]|nr:DRTGG domain-containing protein [Deltaproteobacteria bacterium]
MGGVVTLAELKDILEAEVVSGHERLDEIVSGAFCADLMSDVLSFAKPGCVLITGLANLQALRTAYALDLGAVIVCRGKALPEGFVDAARDLGIPVL